MTDRRIQPTDDGQPLHFRPGLSGGVAIARATPSPPSTDHLPVAVSVGRSISTAPGDTVQRMPNPRAAPASGLAEDDEAEPVESPPSGTAESGDPVPASVVPAEPAPAATPAPAASAASIANFQPGATVDPSAAGILDGLLQNSAFLQPYIGAKLATQQIDEAGKFIIHPSDPDFDWAYITLHKKEAERDNPAFKEHLKLIQGFYFTDDDSIHLRPKTDQANALHEAIHKFSEPGYRRMFGRLVDEGTTQYFANKVHVEFGLPPSTSHGYGQELAFATTLIAHFGENFMAEQFFKDFDARLMLVTLGLTLPEYTAKYRTGDDAKERFLRYLKKLL